ncbi:alpha/beta hydrolase [Azospirillum sp. SYSU D00513]|uniref:alpha/beta hydrolase n=1 Tax=Azospirillum sp. SYSU D00513 TaxID=2812561 RepID=UPI001A95B9CF|nr:alpha/beta hydrolase [Azospirillum sp. SYSU D00513]
MNSIKSLATAALIATAAQPALAAGGPTVEPATQRFLEALERAGGPPIYKLSPTEARNLLSSVQAGNDVPKPAVDIADRTIPGGPTGQVRIRTLRPQGATGLLPVIVYFHGAGWVMGGPDTHDRLIRELAVGSNAAVVFVDYDRSPEAKYPVPLEQDYAALTWVAEHGEELGIDSQRIAIAGDSVGGNMVAVVSQLAKQRGGPEIRYQVLFYPVTDARFDTGSYKQFGEGGYFLTTAAMQYFWDAYLPDAAKRADPTASPLNASVEQLQGLPPALVITAENDVLRDEGEAYGRKLAAAGVPVTQVRFNGTMHDFVMLNPLAATPAARGAIDLANDKLRAAFAR